MRQTLLDCEIASELDDREQRLAIYRDLFSRQVKREQERGVFMEYAWDMNWCDPCAADPLSAEELRSLGVFW